MPPAPAVIVSVPGEGSAELTAGDLGETLVGALEDPLGADVDPRPRCHLPVHREAEVFEAAELIPVGPVGHEVGVGDEHPGRPLVRLQHADRFARLHEHRLVGFQRGEGAEHGVVVGPGSGGPSRSAVHHQVVGPFGHIGVEVVLQHPIGGLLGPTFAAQIGAGRGVDGARGCADVTETHSLAPLTSKVVLTVSPALGTLSTNGN